MSRLSDSVKFKFLEHGLHFSALEYVKKFILSVHVLLEFINTICYKYCYTRVILHNVGEVYIPGHGRYISVLAYARGVSTLGIVILRNVGNIYIFKHGLCISALEQVRC